MWACVTQEATMKGRGNFAWKEKREETSEGDISALCLTSKGEDCGRIGLTFVQYSSEFLIFPTYRLTSLPL